MDTTHVTLTTDDEITDVSRRGWRGRSRTSKKHRIQDYVARLEHELVLAQQLNEKLSADLTAQVAETTAADERCDELAEQVKDLRHRLHVAEKANVANANSVYFSFQPRPITDPEDRVTMPVPQVELLADESDFELTTVDPASTFLDRFLPRRKREERLVPPYAPPAPAKTLSPVTVPSDEMDEEMYDATAASWGARRSQSLSPLA